MSFRSSILYVLIEGIMLVSATGCRTTVQAMPIAGETSGAEATSIHAMAPTSMIAGTRTPLATLTPPSSSTPASTLGPKSPGRTNIQPSADTAVPAPSPTSVPATQAANPPASQPTAAGVAAGQALSPDGKFTAVIHNDGSKVVVTAQDGRVAHIFRMKWFRFVGWTADSRYAVMNHYDQYGNQVALGFDTTQWKEFWISPVLCIGQMDGHCQHGAVKVILDGPSVLMSDGTVVNLATLPASTNDCFAPFFFVWPVTCAEEAPIRMQASQQVFERGRMLWVNKGPYSAATEIYVLLADGEAEIVQDTWTSAEPESDPGIVPPSGMLQPVMGFGKVWRTATLASGQTVQEALGWAVSPERGYGTFYQRASSSSTRGLYLQTADGQVISLLWPQTGTHTRWESVEP